MIFKIARSLPIEAYHDPRCESHAFRLLIPSTDLLGLCQLLPFRDFLSFRRALGEDLVFMEGYLYRRAYGLKVTCRLCSDGLLQVFSCPGTIVQLPGR